MAKAEDWWCERGEGAKYLRQLLELEKDPEPLIQELVHLFDRIDSGETVSLDGLEHRQARKKLRHLMQCLRVTPVEQVSFKTPDKAISFKWLFNWCLEKARKDLAEAQAAAAEKEAAAAAEKAAAAETEEADAEMAPEPVDEEAADLAAAKAAMEENPEVLLLPPKPRIKGPQLPLPGVGLVTGDDSEEEEEVGRETGPRAEGAERAGVDLDNIEEIRMREEWMTTPSESMAAFFGEGKGRKKEHYEIKRSKEEEEAFEKMFKARGPSLLQQQQEGAFKTHEDEIERARKRKASVGDLWGLSARDQAVTAADAEAGGSDKIFFDPEKDFSVKKPITGWDFAKMVENSNTGLTERFSRGQVATSFL